MELDELLRAYLSGNMPGLNPQGTPENYPVPMVGLLGSPAQPQTDVRNFPRNVDLPESQQGPTQERADKMKGNKKLTAWDYAALAMASGMQGLHGFGQNVGSYPHGIGLGEAGQARGVKGAFPQTPTFQSLLAQYLLASQGRI